MRARGSPIPHIDCLTQGLAIVENPYVAGVGESPSQGGLGYTSSSLNIFDPIVSTGGIIPGHNRMETALISSPEDNQAFMPLSPSRFDSSFWESRSICV